MNSFNADQFWNYHILNLLFIPTAGGITLSISYTDAIEMNLAIILHIYCCSGKLLVFP